MIMNAHPVLGAQIIAPVTKLAPELPIIRHHHEWYNGSGYPDRLIGDEIPKLARVLHVADAFEAMTAARPYRMTPLTHEQALGELRKFAGIQFDPVVVDAFVQTHHVDGVAGPGPHDVQPRPIPLIGQAADRMTQATPRPRTRRPAAADPPSRSDSRRRRARRALAAAWCRSMHAGPLSPLPVLIGGIVLGLLARPPRRRAAHQPRRRSSCAGSGSCSSRLIVRFGTECRCSARRRASSTRCGSPCSPLGFGLLLAGLWVNRGYPGMSLAFVGILLERHRHRRQRRLHADLGAEPGRRPGFTAGDVTSALHVVVPATLDATSCSTS